MNPYEIVIIFGGDQPVRRVDPFRCKRERNVQVPGDARWNVTLSDVTPVFQILQGPAPAFFWTSNDQ